METYGVNELRKMFLDFFESKGHLVANSFPLVPQNDNSLLLINAGMAPLKPYFTGQEKPPRTRMATCQKCIRTGDIDNVGKTARHGTFFEMLGNFSIGDYFRPEVIPWAFEILTDEEKGFGIPKEKLFINYADTRRDREGKEKIVLPSRFLEEIPNTLFKNEEKTKEETLQDNINSAKSFLEMLKNRNKNK